MSNGEPADHAAHAQESASKAQQSASDAHQSATTAQSSAAAATDAQNTIQGLVTGLQATLQAPTGTWEWWEQVPAWVVLGAALIGAGFLIGYPSHASNNAWAAVIVALFVGVLLSFRSGFTLGGSASGSSSGAGNQGGAPPAGDQKAGDKQ